MLLSFCCRVSGSCVLEASIAINAPEGLDFVPARIMSKLQSVPQVAEVRQEEGEAVQMQEQALG